MTLHDDTLDPVATFHRLHSSGCFVMPNPWDVGSARALEQHGLQGAGDHERRHGLDAGPPRQPRSPSIEALEHLRTVAAAVHVPVNADFEGGYAVEPADVGANVGTGRGDRDRRALDRGLLGRRGRTTLRVRAGRGAGRRPHVRPSTRAAPASS